MARKGETWNESETYRDAWTLRRSGFGFVFFVPLAKADIPQSE